MTSTVLLNNVSNYEAIYLNKYEFIHILKCIIKVFLLLICLGHLVSFST